MSASYNYNLSGVDNDFQQWSPNAVPLAEGEPCLTRLNDPFLNEANNGFPSSDKLSLAAFTSNGDMLSVTTAGPSFTFPQTTLPEKFDFSWLNQLSTVDLAQGQGNHASTAYGELQTSAASNPVDYSQSWDFINYVPGVWDNIILNGAQQTVNPALIGQSSDAIFRHPSLQTAEPTHLSTTLTHSRPSIDTINKNASTEYPKGLRRGRLSANGAKPRLTEEITKDNSPPFSGPSTSARYAPYGENYRRPKKPILEHKCPSCSYMVKSTRMPDLRRHMQTHKEFKNKAWICSGRFLNGEWTGGCSKEFSRRDALQRHFRDPNNRCSGDVLPHIIDPETSLIISPCLIP